MHVVLKIIGAVLLSLGVFGGFASHFSAPAVFFIVCGAATLAGGIHYGKKEKKAAAKKPDVGQLFEGEQAALAEEIFDKSTADFARIEAVRKELKDPALGDQLYKMQEISSRIMGYLVEHPQLVVDARRFVDTYQDRAASFAEEFLELEKTRIESASIRQTKDKIRTTLDTFDEAYLAEFDKLLHAKLLDVDAEIDVLKETMHADGIEAENKPQSAEKEAETFAAYAAPQQLESRGREPVNCAGRKNRQRFGFGQGGPFGIARRVRHIAPQAPAKGGMPEEMRTRIRHKKLAAGLLAIFLGGFGAHKFYFGKTVQGILYALFCWTSLPFWVGFVEGIRYLAMPMEDFYRQYMDSSANR